MTIRNGNGIAALELIVEEVTEIVLPYLTEPILGDIRLEINTGRTRRIDGWWKVGISPSRWPQRLYPLYEELAIIEERLRDDNHLDILLALSDPVSTRLNAIISE